MPKGSRHRRRHAAATVELAILLPFLMFLFLVAVDWGRIFYYSEILTNCAHQGAIYASDPVAASKSPYQSIQDAATADAGDMQPKPTITSVNGKDSDGNAYVGVTATWQFTTVVNFPAIAGLPAIGGPMNLTRTVRVRVAPSTP
jgi:Flp pilus assembly protein TadG